MRRPLRRLVAAATLVLVAAGLAAQSSEAPRLQEQADDALARGAWYEAVELYRETLRINPNFRDALAGLAEAYYWLEEYDQAQTYVDEARRLARNSPEVLNLAGRIAIGRGDLEAAAQAFARVREIEPNNVQASIGEAELALARGQSVEAARRLEDALRLNPEQRKALLSLVLVYEHLGRDEVARRYLDLARTVHRDRPEVHVLAAEYHLRAGRYEEAAAAARTAQAIDQFNRSASAIRARVALLQESYLEASTIAEELIAQDRSDTGAWYVRAVAKHRTGDVEGALQSIRTALRLAPDDDLLRIWAEWLAMRELDLDHEVRAELAGARAEDARELERRFRFERALRAYQRALQLAPLDLELRRDYAELFRRLGFNASYLQEIELVLEDGQPDERLERRVGILRNSLASQVASRWDLDQFTLDRTRTRLGVYLIDVDATGYPQVEQAFLAFVRRTLAATSGVEVTDTAIVADYAQAFARARSADVDYFVQLSAAASGRVISLDATLMVARTGSRADRFQTVRTGPDYAAAAVDAIATELTGSLPTVSSIVRRSGNSVVIDRGSRDGITAEMRFDVLEPGAVTRAPNSTELRYGPDAVIGTLEVSRTDDLVSEASLEPRGIVDLVSTGDTAVLIGGTADDDRDEATGGTPPSDLFPVLYQRVRSLR